MKYYLVEFVYTEFTDSGEYQHTLSEVFKLESAKDVNTLKKKLNYRFLANKFQYPAGARPVLFNEVQAELQIMVDENLLPHSEFKIYQCLDHNFSHIKNVTLIEETTTNENPPSFIYLVTVKSSRTSTFEVPDNTLFTESFPIDLEREFVLSDFDEIVNKAYALVSDDFYKYEYISSIVRIK